MKMETLQMPLPFRRFLLFFTISMSSLLASYCHGVCEVFKCGDYTFDYPFGTLKSGCGDPDLQLYCDDTSKGSLPLLQIRGHHYYILEPKKYSDPKPLEVYYNHTLKILGNQLLENECDLSENVYEQFFNGTNFSAAQGYTNITLGRTCVDVYSGQPMENIKCKEIRYYNLSVPETSIHCQSEFQLPVRAINLTNPLDQIVGEGLEITWTASKICENCESGYRSCASRKTSSFCYCEYVSYSQNCSSGRKSNTLIILGAAIGTGLLLTVALLFVIMYRKRSSSSKELQLRFVMAPSISKVEKFLQDYTHQMPARYSYSNLKKITNNFADKLGEGGFGVVYKGMLGSGNMVAVKILDQSRQSESQFINEVATIGTLHHVHLVRLMGYCYEGIISALVYEYMANGSLEKFIFAERGEERILRHDQLYSIALGTARGIAYLHEECHSRIIHFDIKPHNILLDEEFTPKVADFGLAKLCSRGNDHMSMTAARGTPGYAAPEVWSGNLGPVTDKSDVYSFGMLLLEMVGGRKNIELVSRSSQVYFPEWAFKLLEKGELEMMLRGRVKAEIGLEDEEKARRMTKVGLWCIQYNSTERPSMSRVVQMLEGSGDVGNPPMPFKSPPAPEASLPSSSEDSSYRIV